jgi:HlyD family secretion protein
MRISRKITIAVLGLIPIFGAGYFFYVSKYLPAQAAETPPVQTARVRTGSIVVATAGVGSLYPAEQIELGFRTGGQLAELNVSAGDFVEAGQVLASLDSASAEMQLEQAEANLQTLLSPAAILEAELAVYNAQKSVDEAYERLAVLISPAVWQAEQDVEAAVQNLAASAGASASELAALEEALDQARQDLEAAQLAYFEEYIPVVFTISEVDPLTKARVEIVKAPSENEIGQARLSVAIAEQKLHEARVYLTVIRGQDVSEEELAAASGTALTRLTQARQAVESARLALENTRLVAPFSGTVTKVSGVPGQTIGASPVVTLISMDEPLLRFFVDETDLALVAVGNRIVIDFDAYPDQPLDGQVIRIEPALATVDGSPALAVWAALEPGVDLPLLPGMSAEVEIIYGEASEALLVPISALRELAPGSYAVFLVQDDGSLKAAPVVVGLKDFTNAQILSGLQAGDVVSTGNVETR